MQTEWIDTFLDLIDSRSFNRTADRLGITQSTVSARVRALEDAVGARLFHRSRAGTEPTTEALRLAPHARILRQEWTLARRSVEKRGAVALTLRISIQNDLAHAQLGPLVGDLRKLLPQTAFYIEPDYSTQMCTDLTTGAQDFGVMFSPKAQAGLYFESVGAIPYRLISTYAQRLNEVEAERYVMAHFPPPSKRPTALHCLIYPPLLSQLGNQAPLNRFCGKWVGRVMSWSRVPKSWSKLGAFDGWLTHQFLSNRSMQPCMNEIALSGHTARWCNWCVQG